MNTKPAEGERRAASGYRAQYLVGAAAALDALQRFDMEWVRVADPDAGRVDDLHIATTVRIDGYQVKWEQYPGTITLHQLTGSRGDKPPLIAQLADGWQRLQTRYPRRKVVVHLVTNAIPSKSRDAKMPRQSDPPAPYHFAAFLEQAWRPARRGGQVDLADRWAAVWEEIQMASRLSKSEFEAFVLDCSLDLQTHLPEESTDLLALCDLLFATAAGPERIIELSREELLRRLGWSHRYRYRSKHRFPAPPFSYRPIQSTVEELKTKLRDLTSGYIGVLGPPGSGKSTLLSRTLPALPIRLIRYYAYVPEAQDPSVSRGESINFLHDVTLRLQNAGIEQGERPDSSNRTALADLFHRQLQALGDDYTETGTKTVILVDGLDHIAREQRPERSLLRDLPLPGAMPEGVYIVLGSQTSELADLPPRVHHGLSQQERRIEMDQLSRSDVYAIAEESMPFLKADELRRVFELSSGHPLALVYLLKRLRLAENPDERARLLHVTVPYSGDIEDQYWGHWRDVENDDALVHALAVIARMRGPISIRWISGWLEIAPLRKLKTVVLQYFEEEGEDRWGFFHNSFRLFLQERTADLVPGQTAEEQNQAYHRELAARCEASSPPWRWEALYHRHSATEYRAVLETATQEWFHEQVEALRPLDSIQTDARLALQAAGRCEDVVALARLTLVGAALEQRAWTLEDSGLPALLLEAGQPMLAAGQLRDGNRLRVDAEKALSLAPRLLEAGFAGEAQRIFELAEPLEFLSGRPIPDDHTRPQNLSDLLREWVRSATVFRGAEETTRVVRRIRVEPSRIELGHDGLTGVEQASLELQDSLLFHGALACAGRGDWAAWEVLYRTLREEGTHLDRCFALLRSAEEAEATNETERARRLLDELLAILNPNELREKIRARSRTEAYLSIAELLLELRYDEEEAQRWIEASSPIPLEDAEFYRQGYPTLEELRFRRGQLRYLLGESCQPEVMLREAEASTEFGEFVPDEKRAARRQIARAVLQLSRLWAWGQPGFNLTPSTFLQEVCWILDFFGPRWATHSASVRLAVTGARTEVLLYIVAAAVQHGSKTVEALRKEFECRWMDSDEGSQWLPDLQRELTLALADAGVGQAWAKAQLHRIGPAMLQDMEPYSRVEACEAQAKAWLVLGDHETAVVELRRMVRVARGIRGEDDYQLSKWVRWLGRVNEIEPQYTESRTKLMLRRMLSVEGVVSGVGDAAEELLAVTFRWRPRQTVRLLKGFLERTLIGHQAGATYLLRAALHAQQPPVREVLHTTVELIIGLAPGVEPDLLETLIVRASDQLGYEAALHVAQCLVQRIGVDALVDSRPGWYEGVAAGLRAISADLDRVGLQPSDIEYQPSRGSGEVDRSIHLTTGEHLEPDEVLARVETVDDFRALLEAEDRGSSGIFDWASLIEQLAVQLGSASELTEVEDLICARLSGNPLNTPRLSRSLSALSKGWLGLGYRDRARALAEQALDATEPSGWDPYFDGGARHAALRELIVIDQDWGTAIAIDLYARDLSERFPRPGRVALQLYEVLSLLTDEVPVAQVWREIEPYLDDLFVAVVPEPQPTLEALLEEPSGEPRDETPEQAIGDLLVLHLDHPSYAVAQAAVRGCAAALVDDSRAVAVALQEALSSTNQAVERALMVLDGVNQEELSLAFSFKTALTRLLNSPNITIRTIAYGLLASVSEGLPIPSTIERETPAIFSLRLPELTFHRTEQAIEEHDAPILVGDPARMLSPLDVEARRVAEAAGVPEDNVLYRVAVHLRRLEKERTWLADEHEALDSRRVSVFLDQVGLKYAHYKPHVEPARQALAHVVAELYDGGYLSPGALRWLSRKLMHHDPAFVLGRPDGRPECVSQLGGLPDDDYSCSRLPDDWLETAEDSLALLRPRTSDGWIIVGERTRLKQLQKQYPGEERMATTRLVNEHNLWDGLGVARGYPPFAGLLSARVSSYLDLEAQEDHLLIACDGRYFDAPQIDWLALNPVVGRALGWRPVNAPWFPWADEQGDLVVKSVWWSDGNLECFNERAHVEVGCGWLVVMTESGFRTILKRTGGLSRGGVVRRTLGSHGAAGRGQAFKALELP